MKRRSMLRAAATALPALGLASCGSTAGPAEAGSRTLVLGHEGSDTDPRQEAALRLKELVEEGTSGRLLIDVHSNGTLGGLDHMIEGMQLGSTDIVIESLLSLEGYSKLASVETVPFLYDDVEHFSRVWEGAVGDEIKAALAEATGYRIFGNMYRGPRHLTTSEPVGELPRLSEFTVRTPSAQTMVTTWQGLGARAEAMPWGEVYSALEQGVIDGQENPLSSILFGSIHEVSPAVTMTAHVYANFHFLMWDETLNGISEPDRAALLEAGAVVGQEYTENQKAMQAEYQAEMEADGAEFHELTDRPAWVEESSVVIADLPVQVQQWVDQIRTA